MAPRRDRSGSGSFVETMSRRRASLDSEIERPSPLAFVRKGSAGAAGTAIGEIISGGRSAGSAAANPPPPPPRQERGQRRPTVTGAGWRPTHAGILSRRLSQQHGECFFIRQALTRAPLTLIDFRHGFTAEWKLNSPFMAKLAVPFE